jgi:deoxyribonuclease-4
MSIAGGLHRAAEAAQALGMDTAQLFTANPQSWGLTPVAQADGGWEGKPLSDHEVRSFRRAAKASGLKYLTAHDSYLINLAAPADDLYRKSIAAFRREVERAEALGLSYLVTHPGAHTGSGEDAGLARVAAALDAVHTACPGYKVKVLLETTAGQGSSLGARFEHLARLLDLVKDPGRLGVCFDTCHVFAAGYPLGTDADYDATTAEFDRVVGLKRIKAFHLNDSVKGLGSRVDRHAGIGLGEIGEHAFRRLVTDPRFRTRPMILETPKRDEDGREMDPVNLAKLRGYVTSAAA